MQLLSITDISHYANVASFRNEALSKKCRSEASLNYWEINLNSRERFIFLCTTHYEAWLK